MDKYLTDVYRKRASVRCKYSFQRMECEMAGFPKGFSESIEKKEKKALKEFDAQYPHLKLNKDELNERE